MSKFCGSFIRLMANYCQEMLSFRLVSPRRIPPLPEFGFAVAIHSICACQTNINAKREECPWSNCGSSAILLTFFPSHSFSPVLAANHDDPRIEHGTIVIFASFLFLV